MFKGRLREHLLASFQQAKGITVTAEQRDALHTINCMDCSLVRIDALAGSGKRMIISVLLRTTLPDLEQGHAFIIVVPARALRDVTVQTFGNVLAPGGLSQETRGLARPAQRHEEGSGPLGG